MDHTLELNEDEGGDRTASQVRLVVTEGPHAGRSWVFEHPVELTIGRMAPSHVVLQHEKSLSRQHATLRLNPPDAELSDLGSRNGTFVNGIRMTQASLSNGDQFGVGETKIQVEVCQIDDDEQTFPIDEENEAPRGSTAPQDTFSRTRVSDLPSKPSFGTCLKQDATRPNDSTRQPNDPGPTLASDGANGIDEGKFSHSAEFDSTGSDTSEQRFAIGQSVGPYRFDELIGSGGMASVFRASHRRSEKQYAIKIIRSDLSETDKRMRMFVREATVLTQLRHPRIVHAYELGIHHRSPYLVMQYLPALDIVSLVDSQSIDKRVRTSIWIISRVLEALHYLHSEGIVHRDVKPANILAYKIKHRLHVKLADFGLAKLFADAGFSGMTSERSLRGTLAYMSPDQFNRSVDAGPTDDLFSCGATLFRLLVGKVPNMVFKSEETLCELWDSKLPIDITTLIERAINPDPEKRFSSVAEFAAGIEQIRKARPA